MLRDHFRVMITSRFKPSSNGTTCHQFFSYWLLGFAIFFSANSFGQGIRFVGEESIPLLYENNQQKKSGALVELALALSATTGLESTVETMPWARAYETALQEPNVVLVAVLKTPEREPELQWIGKVLQAPAQLIALKERTDVSITTLEQAKKYVLASVRGYGSAKYLLRQGFSEEHNLVLTSHPSQIWGLLYNKRVDLVLSNLDIGRFEAKHIGLEPSLMQSKLQINEIVNELHFATGLATPSATVLVLQDGLNSLKKDGSYDAILKKWNLN